MAESFKERWPYGVTPSPVSYQQCKQQSSFTCHLSNRGGCAFDSCTEYPSIPQEVIPPVHKFLIVLDSDQVTRYLTLHSTLCQEDGQRCVIPAVISMSSLMILPGI
jgi:hypothetical protein